MRLIKYNTSTFNTPKILIPITTSYSMDCDQSLIRGQKHLQQTTGGRIFFLKVASFQKARFIF